MYTNKKGFTLIELLVVIAIIGLLASVVLASLETAREKGRDSARLSDMKNVQIALELYFDDFGSYPAPAGSSPFLIPQVLVDNGYLGAIPSNPVSGDDYDYRLFSGSSVCSQPSVGCYLLNMPVESQGDSITSCHFAGGGTYSGGSVSLGDGSCASIF